METDKLIVLSEMSEEEKLLVKDQLAIILASTYFNSAKQMKRFLEYVVEKTLAGQGNLLKQYTIGVEALALPIDFDSDDNPVIRIMAGRVRNRLKDFYDNTDNNEILVGIPKGAYTPEFKYSQNKTSDILSVSNNEEVYISSGPRVALLSFTDKTQNYICNKLLLQSADSLANELSRFVIFDLIVYSPFADKSESHGIGKDKDMGTDYVLALYVQELPSEQFELICRLVKVGSKEIIWSETYNLNNKTAVVDQNNVIGKISAVIADVHQGKLIPHWARNLLLDKDNIQCKFKVLTYYRQYYDNFSKETFAEAVSVCDTALEHDTNDIIVNILYSDLCRRDFVHGYNVIESSLKRGIECAERVTHLKQDSHEAHFNLGQLLFSQGEWDRSVEEFNSARSITNSHGVIEYGCGFYFCLMGKWEEGLRLVNKAIELSSAYPSWYHMPIFLSLYSQEKYQEALIEANKIVTPNIPQGPMARCITYAQLGDITKAKRELSEVVNRTPDIGVNGKSNLLRLFGNEELVEKIWEGIEIAIKG